MQFRKVLPLLLSIGLLIVLLMKPKKSKTKISANFTEGEFDIGPGTPAEIRNNVYRLVANVLQPAREFLALPIGISSGYRSAAHNEDVGGAKTSQHIKGQAADIYPIPNNEENRRVLLKIIKNAGNFDQLISYPPGFPGYKYGGIHVSYNEGKNRQQVIIKSLASPKEKEAGLIDKMLNALGIY